MKRSILCFVLMLLVLTVTGGARAQSAPDTPANREKAAQRYLKAVPVQSMVDSMTSEVAKQMPPDQRAKFVDAMKHKVRWNVIIDETRHTLVQTFTVAEINKMTDFYGSSTGKSIVKKFGRYMAAIMPAMQQEMTRAMKEMQPAGQGGSTEQDH